jgi:hypothetical protein
MYKLGISVRGPLHVLKDSWLQSDLPDDNLIDYISDFKERLHQAVNTAHEKLKVSHGKMKRRYDCKSQERNFPLGSKVLALLPMPSSPLKARFSGPYTVVKKINELDYVIETPNRRKKQQVCHINMLKLFHERDGDQKTVSVVKSVETDDCVEGDDDVSQSLNTDYKVDNSTTKPVVKGLLPEQSEQLDSLFNDFSEVFSDFPGRTNLVVHDIKLTDSKPVKQQPYRMHPTKLETLEKEVKEMLDLGLVERSYSDYSSPVVMIPKPDGTQRVCIDYRKLNAVTTPDSFPIPRVDDLIDRVSNSVYLTKLDLRKGYYQCPLSESAKPLTAFVTPFGLYQFRVMPFGLRNAPATFQRLMNLVTEGMTNCTCYIDDLCIYDMDWENHCRNLKEIFERLKSAGLTLNLPKCEFGKAQITYLGYTVGQGKVLPKEANVKVIRDFPRPTSKKEIKRFLGMAGFYCKFVRNFSTIAEPLTNLLKKDKTMRWSPECQTAFDNLKAILQNSPVLKAPDFEKPFILNTDASDVGSGGVLLQV